MTRFAPRGRDVVPGDATAGTHHLHGHVRAPIVARTADERLLRALWRRPTRAERRVNSGAVDRPFDSSPSWPRRFVMPNERAAGV